MTDERMTQGDVRLREELDLGIRDWEDYGGPLLDALAPVVERIVAARVGEVVERVASEIERELICCPDNNAEHDFCGGAILARRLVLNAALRAADAPLGGQERDGGRGGAGGEERL